MVPSVKLAQNNRFIRTAVKANGVHYRVLKRVSKDCKIIKEERRVYAHADMGIIKAVRMIQLRLGLTLDEAKNLFDRERFKGLVSEEELNS